MGIGAVLSQVDDEGREYTTSFASRSCNPAERNYSNYNKECLADVWGVIHFRDCLFGQTFSIETDHQPLKWLMTTAKLTRKFARWALTSHVYDFGIEQTNANADRGTHHKLVILGGSLDGIGHPHTRQ